MPAALAGHRDSVLSFSLSLSLSLSFPSLSSNPRRPALPVRVPAATGWEVQVSTPRRDLHHHTTPVSSLPTSSMPAAVSVTGPPSCASIRSSIRELRSCGNRQRDTDRVPTTTTTTTAAAAAAAAALRLNLKKLARASARAWTERSLRRFIPRSIAQLPTPPPVVCLSDAIIPAMRHDASVSSGPPSSILRICRFV